MNSNDPRIQWLKAGADFKPVFGLQAGSSVFDDWLDVTLHCYAAIASQTIKDKDALREHLNRRRIAEIRAHNELRPKDILWLRDISFRVELVEMILNELERHNVIMSK